MLEEKYNDIPCKNLHYVLYIMLTSTLRLENVLILTVLIIFFFMKIKYLFCLPIPEHFAYLIAWQFLSNIKVVLLSQVMTELKRLNILMRNLSRGLIQKTWRQKS